MENQPNENGKDQSRYSVLKKLKESSQVQDEESSEGLGEEVGKVQELGQEVALREGPIEG